MSASFEEDVQVVGQTLQQAFARLKDRLMHFTECQLATVEDLYGRPRFPKGATRRHVKIAIKMVDECRIHGVTVEDAKASKCPRLYEQLRKTGRLYERMQGGQ